MTDLYVMGAGFRAIRPLPCVKSRTALWDTGGTCATFHKYNLPIVMCLNTALEAVSYEMGPGYPLATR
jgi:hypothetical protein